MEFQEELLWDGKIKICKLFKTKDGMMGTPQKSYKVYIGQQDEWKDGKKTGEKEWVLFHVPVKHHKVEDKEVTDDMINDVFS